MIYLKTFLSNLLCILCVSTILLSKQHCFWICILFLLTFLIFGFFENKSNIYPKQCSILSVIFQSLLFLALFINSQKYNLNQRLLLTFIIDFIIIFEKHIRKIPFMNKEISINIIDVVFFLILIILNLLN